MMLIIFRIKVLSSEPHTCRLMAVIKIVIHFPLGR